MNDLDDLRRVIQAAAAAAEDWHDIGSALRKELAPDASDPRRFGVFAFDYMLQLHEDREGTEDVFVPMMEGGGSSYPPPLAKLPTEAFRLWEQLVDDSEPAVASRLCDLLWEVRHGDQPYLFAQRAIDAYIQVAQGSWPALHRAEALVRALELARSVNDNDRLAVAADQALEDARTCIAGAERAPGVSLRLLAAVVSLPLPQRPQGLDDGLAAAADRYADDPWNTQSVLELQADLYPEQRPDYHRAIVRRWQQQAEKQSGFLRLARLQTASELAQLHGLAAEHDEIVHAIQAMRPEDYDMKSVTASVQIPADKIERFHTWFVDVETWQDALTSFGTAGGAAPSGDHERNISRVRDHMDEFPVQFLFSKVILGPHGGPLAYAATQQEHAAVELSNQERYGVRLWALSAVEVLERIRVKFGIPDERALAAFLEGPIVAEARARRFARAFHLYWAGQFDEAAHILAPRLEATIRDLAREAGCKIIREPQAGTPGGVRTLGTILSNLQGRLDESWRRYLTNLLTDPLGVNLRNLVSHGLIEEAAQEDAALLLHAAVLLAGLRSA